MILTIVEAVIGSSASEGFFPTKPTESVHAIVKIHINNRLSKLDGSFDDGTTVVRGPVANCKGSTEEILAVPVQ